MAIPLQSITAESVANAIFVHWISMFGCPSVITIDRGPQFQSTLFFEFTNLLRIKHVRTTVYHSCANGLVEHFHRQLKYAWTAVDNGRTWVSNYRLLFGTSLTLPGQIFHTTSLSAPTTQFPADLKKEMADIAYTPTRSCTKPYYIYLQIFIQRISSSFDATWSSVHLHQTTRALTRYCRASKYFIIDVADNLHRSTKTCIHRQLRIKWPTTGDDFGRFKANTTYGTRVNWY